MDLAERLAAVREVDIETRGPDEVVRRTTIWPVVDDGVVFVRALRGTGGQWYREATARPDAALRVEGEVVPVRVVAAADDESVARATSGYRRKYPDSPYLGTMTRAEILDATLRLDPR
jgi:hypothetical protein